jgi:hypothetical protein
LRDSIHRITESVQAEEIVESAINSIAWNLQRIRHSQFVYDKVVDFKMPDFASTDNKAPDREGAQSKRANRQRTKRESSNTLRSDRQRAEAHRLDLI